MVAQVARAFALVLLVLIAIKAMAGLVTVAIGPITTLLAVVLVGMWFLDHRH